MVKLEDHQNEKNLIQKLRRPWEKIYGSSKDFNSTYIIDLLKKTYMNIYSINATAVIIAISMIKTGNTDFDKELALERIKMVYHEDETDTSIIDVAKYWYSLIHL
jgi:hypothetical protein